MRPSSRWPTSASSGTRSRSCPSSRRRSKPARERLPARVPGGYARQQYYRARYARRRPGWRDSLALYQQLAAAAPGGRLLDVGAGHSELMAEAYRDRRAVALDLDLDALRANPVTRRRVAARAEALPFRAGSFDVVLAAWVLEHLPQPEAAAREVARVLTPGGRFVFLTPNAWNYNVWLIRAVPNRLHDAFTRRLYGRQEGDTFPVRYRLNTPRAVRRILGAAGLREVALHLNGDPSYVSFNEPLFRVACAVERVLDLKPLRRARVHLVGSFQKPP